MTHPFDDALSEHNRALGKVTVPEILRPDLWLGGTPVPAFNDLAAVGFRDCLLSFERGSGLDMTAALRIRDIYISRYGFAIPCAEALEALVALGPLLEVGAGTGYWSALLARKGADIVATDIAVGMSHKQRQAHKANYTFGVGSHHAVEALDARAAIDAYPGRAVLAVWPDYTASWAAEVVEALPAGAAFALVSEGAGGCVGDDRLFEVLDRDYEEVSCIELPVFPGMHDRLDIFVRRRIGEGA